MNKGFIKNKLLNTKNNYRKINQRTTNFISKANKIHGDKYDYSKVVYKNNDTKVTIVCPIHKEFDQLPSNHLKSGCNECFLLKRKVSREDFINKSNLIHNCRYDYSKVVYKNTTTKVEIICPKHGSFWQEPYAHYSKKNECPHCSRDKNRITLDAFISKANKIHGQKYDYSKVVIDKYSSYINIQCPIHGIFKQRTGSHLNGNGCIKCYKFDSRKSLQDFIKDAISIHGDKYDYSKVIYVSNKHPVEVICKTHGSFMVKPNAHLSSKNGCPRCMESKGETEIIRILNKYNIKFIREYKIPGYKYRYDFYLPDYNIYIEYHGQQHYRPLEIFGGIEEHKKTLLRDREKKLLVKLNNGKLITLPYLHLAQNRLEAELIKGLKRYFWHWLLINNELKVFKNISTLCEHFQLSNKINTREILNVLNNKLGNVRSLF